MLIRAGYELAYDCVAPTPMLLMVHVHPSRMADLKTPEALTTEPALPLKTYLDGFGNICTRVTAPPGRFTIRNDFVVEDSGLPDRIVENAHQHAIEDLPDDILVFLLGSRYCETDRLTDIAWKLFGNTPPGWPRVQAIVDYVHERITFGYEHARSDKTAWNGYQEQLGVCRDFAHLAITFCRCMNIPARYCTGYLGDIGVPPVDFPMDFSAWFDVYLGGEWHTFDARHNTPRIGRILMARGRDATDTAISTAFGMAQLAVFKVHTDEVSAVPAA
jgi:transglutaminase-like putative cysteine protease